MNGRTLSFALISLLSAAPLAASYSNLLATADGSAVLLEAKTGIRTTQWYELRRESKRTVAEPIPGPVADISEDGAVVASSFYGVRYCGFGGSSCWVSPGCRAEFAVDGPGVQDSLSGRRTFIRLDRTGRRAWIEQPDEFCRSIFGPPDREPLRGLFEIPGLTLVEAAEGLAAANTRFGRRLITNRDQVLARAPDGKLVLIEESAPRMIPTQFEVLEAVIDADGRNIIYVASPAGQLRWIDLDAGSEDDLAGFPTAGTAPAISDDGALLAFLSPESHLQIYRRQSRTLGTLEVPGEEIREFVLTGTGQFLFAVTVTNRLIRADLASGEVETWLDPLASIEVTSTLQSDQAACPYICYGPFDPLLFLGRSSLVVLEGRNVDRPGWRIRIGDVVVEPQPLAEGAIWIQVPSDYSAGGDVELSLYHPNHPLESRATAQVADRVVTCFGALHEAFDRIVTEADPAQVGEIVHIFLTGLRGVEDIPDGTPNPTDRLIPIEAPPALAPDTNLEQLFFGLAPGFIGLQQLDARVLRHVPHPPEDTPPPLFHYEVRASGCTLPPTQP